MIDLIESESLLESARVVGEYLNVRLEELQDKHLGTGEVHGMGLMQGVELVRDRKTREPAVAETRGLMNRRKATA